MSSPGLTEQLALPGAEVSAVPSVTITGHLPLGVENCPTDCLFVRTSKTICAAVKNLLFKSLVQGEPREGLSKSRQLSPLTPSQVPT